jgi:hypothetical protein
MLLPQNFTNSADTNDAGLTSDSMRPSAADYDTIVELVSERGDSLDEKDMRAIFHALYSTNKQIGKGGFGVIFSGYRIRDNLPIAIKVIKKSKITQWFKVCGICSS